MAEDRGIDLRQVHGTGPGGRITKTDIEHFAPPAAATGAPAAAPAAGLPAPNYGTLPSGPDVEIIEVSKLRARIARRMVESKQQVPHFYVTTEIDVEALLNLRKQINAGLDDNHKVTVNDLVVKATALTLRQFPNLNSHFYGDKIVRYKHINIGIAVALPQGGLMNVVAHDADKLSLGTLAQINKEMIARAREGKVKPDDVQGATFTVSNLGTYDVEHFLAVINPPEAGILAISSARKVPVVLPDGTLGVGNRMKVTISVDHRVSDGAEGAQYMQAFKKLIEAPMGLLL
jgi:pyruvate dehydrogenase E2 component (dihydrolipoamide acetyltransferase)